MEGGPLSPGSVLSQGASMGRALTRVWAPGDLVLSREEGSMPALFQSWGSHWIAWSNLAPGPGNKTWYLITVTIGTISAIRIQSQIGFPGLPRSHSHNFKTAVFMGKYFVF